VPDLIKIVLILFKKLKQKLAKLLQKNAQVNFWIFCNQN